MLITSQPTALLALPHHVDTHALEYALDRPTDPIGDLGRRSGCRRCQKIV